MDSKALAELVRIKNLILDILKRNTKRVPTPQPTVTGVQATIKMPKFPFWCRCRNKQIRQTMTVACNFNFRMELTRTQRSQEVTFTSTL
ncbi:hypothetical protein ScPMuIL_015369 [Solemya velum]